MRLKDYLSVSYVFGNHKDGRVDVCFSQRDIVTHVTTAEAGMIMGLINERGNAIEWLLDQLLLHDPGAYRKFADHIQEQTTHETLTRGG